MVGVCENFFGTPKPNLIMTSTKLSPRIPALLSEGTICLYF